MARNGRRVRGRVQKCKLKECNRKVNIDRANSEYCYQHEFLSKTGAEISEHSAEKRYSDAMDGEARNRIYYELYVPPMTGVSRIKLSSISAKTALPKLDRKVIDTSIIGWEKLTKNIDMFNPEQAYENREEILSKMQKLLNKRGYESNTLELEGGRVFDHKGQLLGVKDHKALIIEGEPSDKDGKSKYIIDVSTAAPFKGVFSGDIRDSLTPGDPNASGLNIEHLAEFGWGNSVKWSTMTSQGEILWDNRTKDDTYIEEQEAFVLSSPPIKVAPIKYPSAERYYEDQEPRKEDEHFDYSEEFSTRDEREQRIIEELLRDED